MENGPEVMWPEMDRTTRTSKKKGGRKGILPLCLEGLSLRPSAADKALEWCVGVLLEGGGEGSPQMGLGCRKKEKIIKQKCAYNSN